MATQEVSIRPSTAQVPATLTSPKATLLALDQVIETVQELDNLSALAKAAKNISDLGVATRIDTVTIAQNILADDGMRDLVHCVVSDITSDPECSLDKNTDDFVSVARIFAELIIAVAWKNRGNFYLTDTRAALASIADQVNGLPGEPLANGRAQ